MTLYHIISIWFHILLYDIICHLLLFYRTSYHIVASYRTILISIIGVYIIGVLANTSMDINYQATIYIFRQTFPPIYKCQATHLFIHNRDITQTHTCTNAVVFPQRGFLVEMKKPHAIFIPYPAQGHINPMMKLAKLLHLKGFHISFVNTHFNHKRLLRSQGPSALDGLPDFRFYSIPDGLPPSDADSTQSSPDLCVSIPKHCLEPFCELITRLNGASDVPQVTCIVFDGAMSFTLEAAKKFGLPDVLFWTSSACGLLAYTHYRDLIQKGYIPLKGTILHTVFVLVSCMHVLFADLFSIFLEK
ncbi:putative 7-deoxyloganetin glucosyltransferase [Helianthus debilis subsp. tardiflorus]